MEDYTNLDKICDTFIDCKADHLLKYVGQYSVLGIDVADWEEPMTQLDTLISLSERLDHEETENLGLSKEAHRLRVQWRKACKSIERHMKKRIKDVKDYNREWSKPRKGYIFTETGEVHNGLWWTIKYTIFYTIRGYYPKPMSIIKYDRRYH